MTRRTNLALAALLVAAVVSGLVSQAVGTDWTLDPAVVHGVVALAILLLAPWKQAIIRRGLRRRRGSRWFSLALLGLVLIALASGLVHATGLVRRIGPLTVMQIHVGSGVLALGLAVDHYRRHPVKPGRVDLDRRAFLRTSVTLAGAGAAWLGLEGLSRVAGFPGQERRFTGSHERGSFDPAALPTTSWLDDRVQHIDPGEWRVAIDGVAHSLDDLARYADDTFDAVLDCTGGWYSEQTWTGIRLDHLIDGADARSVMVGSATGYGRRFPVADLEHLWLVTALGGAPLGPGHGFPARIVAPGRRGFWWVKWVTEISRSRLPWWVQTPFPLT